MRLLAVYTIAVIAFAAGRADLAPFGKIKGWTGGDGEKVYSRKNTAIWKAVAETGSTQSNLGIEWDEPREFHEIRVAFQGEVSPEKITPEYWVSSWPPPEGRGGWTLTDTPWSGEWRAIRATRMARPGGLIFRFEPLAAEENPNAKHRPGTPPRYRRALKVRLRFSTPAPPVVTAFEVYGSSNAANRDVLIETGCENKPAHPVSLEIYNGRIERTLPQGRGVRATLMYTDHEPESNDRTILTIRSGGFQFGVAMDDLLHHKGIYVRDAGIFIGDATSGFDFQSYLGSGKLRPGRDIVSRVGVQPEQSLERAMADVPALAMTNRRPYRYIPLSFPGTREKYGLLFNGNAFIGKRESKLFADEKARMLWEGNTITWRIGTGAVPDFREREAAARQQVLNDDLPVAVTDWNSGGVNFRQEAFVTLLDAPLDPLKNRGDEVSVLLMKITATNRARQAVRAPVWLHVDPIESLTLRDGVLTGAEGRFRAALKASVGSFALASLPPEADYRGQAARWDSEIAPGSTVTFHVRLTFFPTTDASLMRRIAEVDYHSSREKIIAFWRHNIDAGMKLDVPDEILNRFHRSVLQHMLLSVFRDVPSGLYMGPCGTYNYNMFANETSMQARLLDMRGLHDWAARFLEPWVARQGSKPFPGRFRDGSAIYHGVFFDKDHDYTHSGYNLNHGWMLWALSEHYLFTRDREWLRAHIESMKKAAEWVVSERASTMRADEDGRKVWEYGLLPAGQLEDNEEWLYWYAVNGYAYKGLKYFALALRDTEPELSGRYARQAEAYREDIRAAALRSMAAAPVAPLGDGTWVPTVPSRTHMHGRDLGWIRNILYGALAMVDTEVFSPDEKVTEWILEDHEDNLFMAPWSFSVADRDWFSRGGITLQPNLVNTPMTYLRRDAVGHALRPFYNTFAVSYYPDVNAFTEWAPSFGTSGGPFFKTSDEAGFLTWLRQMLLREEGETLWIASGAPKRWFRHGQRIALGGGATYFGKVSFTIRSRVAEGFIEAVIDLPQSFRGKEVLLRLRHPEGKKITRAAIDGAACTVDPSRDLIHVPATPGAKTVRAYY
jgi:hypothetical protein